jgi:hypothetical protein
MRRGLFGFWVSAGVAFWGLGLSGAVAAPNAPAPNGYAMADRAAAGDSGGQDDLEQLQAAARRGGMSASLKLAKLYSEGRIVAHDEVKACELYGTLADKHSQIDRSDPGARVIAEAFRSWAFCYLRGAQGWEKNLVRAAELFHQAGVILDDPESLYELSKLYLKGEGVSPNARLAVHFLRTAAHKRFAPAQAMLGTLMWQGKVLKQQRINGLALIKFALEVARPEDKVWIDREYEEALLTAKKEEEKDALLLVAEWKKAYAPESTGTTSPLIVSPPAQVAPAPLIASPPPPVRAPGAPPQPRLATPPANVKPPVEQQNEYGTLPTRLPNALPPAATPPEE